MSERKPLCFVIQEFDNGGTYDSRYTDTIEPALRAINVKPLRADKILGLNPVVDKIENAIKEANICVAEVSTNNPNVWLEVGYALALNKPTILLCDKGKREKLPFDIQHRPVIFYSSESKKGFEELEKELRTNIEYELGLVPLINDQVSLLKSKLKVMCWESTHWQFYPLDKATVIPKKDALIIKNTTYIYKFCRIIFDEILEDNFLSNIILEGNYRNIELDIANGQDKAISINPSEQNINIKIKNQFKISRYNDDIKFLKPSGQRFFMNKFKADNSMKCYVGVTMDHEATVKIYTWTVDKNKKSN